MKKLLLTILLACLSFAQDDYMDYYDKDMYKAGEKVFEAKCASCHVKFMDHKILIKNFVYEDNKMLNLKAPTGNQISFRLKQMLGDKEDIESQLFEDTEFVRDYLKNPDKEKTICLKGVIDHFDTMPSMKGKISDDEIDKVVHFLYFLEGFEGINEFYKKK